MRLFNQIFCLLVFLTTLISISDSLYCFHFCYADSAEVEQSSLLAEQSSSAEQVPLIAQVDDVGNAPEGAASYSMDYFGILYGPALKNPTAYQPSPESKPNFNRPLLVKNFLSLNYGLSDQVFISGTAYWHWQPVLKHEFLMRDPYFRVAHNQLLTSDHFNLYADFRVHFPITPLSRETDLLTSLQTFQVWTFQPSGGLFSLGLYSSFRYNWFGSQGYGYDFEIYLGPNLSFQLSSTVAFTLLYEMGMSHVFGDPIGVFLNDGTDLEPGLSWAITPNLVINPYLNLFPNDTLSWQSTSFGMTLSWMFF